MIPDPYIPEQVVDPDDFIGRSEEIEKFETFLDFSIKGKPRNIATGLILRFRRTIRSLVLLIGRRGYTLDRLVR